MAKNIIKIVDSNLIDEKIFGLYLNDKKIIA